jgi:hypothetical protein
MRVEMSLTTGVEETYYKSFVLTESGLKEFHKIMENAAQRFPEPAEVVYTVVTSDFRYFETKRIEDVLHDLDVQKRSIIQLAVEAGFIEQPSHIEGDIIHKETREHWNIRLIFSIVQKDLWDTYHDKISIRVISEDRKWASDYIDRLEDQVYRTPKGNHAPDIIFWLFAIPLSVLTATYVSHILIPKPWLAESSTRLWFFACTLASVFMVGVGIARTFFSYNPHSLRMLFGPESGFVWGQGQVNFEEREKIKQYAFWVIGGIFLYFLFVSMKFAVR